MTGCSGDLPKRILDFFQNPFSAFRRYYMIDKNFTTIEQQIDILKKRGLKFGSEETASSLLLRFGYYNIINGYKDPYITVINDNEKYKDNVTFEQIYSLYSLGRAIRNEVMNSLLEFEDNLRAILSYVLGSNFSADEKIYLNRHNFSSLFS